jgi:hypothetical protein
LWAGGKDNVVPRATVRVLKQSYELLGVTQIRHVEEERAKATAAKALCSALSASATAQGTE